MFTHLTDMTKALVFYAITFALALAVTFVPAEGDTLPLLSMLAPIAAVLLVQLVITRDGYTRASWAVLGLHRLGTRFWGLALLAPLVVLGASNAVVWGTGLAGFAPTPALTPGEAGVGWLGFAFLLLVGIVRAALTFALAEEIGWRGYLLPRLASLGPGRALLLTGLLHGLFHLPLLLLTPFYHPEGNRLIVVPLFLASVATGGLVMGYMRLASGSLWPASLAHAAHNAFWALFGQWTVGASPLVTEYLAGESGLLPIFGYALLAAWLVRRMGHARRAPAAAPTPPVVLIPADRPASA
jgi:membrane protease YdiL (CAAX protease family)